MTADPDYDTLMIISDRAVIIFHQTHAYPECNIAPEIRYVITGC